MKIGIVFPQTEIGNDPLVIRDYAQTAEELGFNHILTYEHVLGANPDRPEGWSGIYDYQDAFHEPFVLFSYLAGLTKRIEFVTGILILPQRQTALVAKQSANLDILSGGRLRLGIGVGWNETEFIALDMNYHDRGSRIEEQVKVLRELWGNTLVNYDGRWHRIPDMGLNPLPIQQPIPIWFGGHADKVLERIARLADGWMPNYKTPDQAQPSLSRIYSAMEKYGRDPAELGLEAKIRYGDGDLPRIIDLVKLWKNAGATHLSFNTMLSGVKSPRDHIKILKELCRFIET